MVADAEGRPKRMPVGERRSGDGGEEGGDGDRRDRRRRGRGRRGRGEGGPRGEEDEGAREGGIKVSCCSVSLWITAKEAYLFFSPALNTG